LGLAFEDGEAGQAIFRAWRERLGVEDHNDVLRIAIITGISKKHPSEYAVIVGPNLSHANDLGCKVFVMVSRIQRMTPANATNLDGFITEYRKFGIFLLAPAKMSSSPSTPFMRVAILKRSIYIRPAWQIGENDPDMIALDERDEPIIPAEVLDPPVNKALARKRSFRQAEAEGH
jgi:hypothetical protein